MIPSYPSKCALATTITTKLHVLSRRKTRCRSISAAQPKKKAKDTSNRLHQIYRTSWGRQHCHNFTRQIKYISSLICNQVSSFIVQLLYPQQLLQTCRYQCVCPKLVDLTVRFQRSLFKTDLEPSEVGGRCLTPTH